jgi:hypothetical protein
MIKQPSLLILDSIAGTDNEADVALRAAVRGALPETTILYAASEDEAARGADLVLKISEDGNVTCAPPESSENAT